MTPDEAKEYEVGEVLSLLYDLRDNGGAGLTPSGARYLCEAVGEMAERLDEAKALRAIADAALADNACLAAEVNRHDERNADLERASRECVDDANRARDVAEAECRRLRTELVYAKQNADSCAQGEREARWEVLQLREEVARLQGLVTP